MSKRLRVPRAKALLFILIFHSIIFTNAIATEKLVVTYANFGMGTDTFGYTALNEALKHCNCSYEIKISEKVGNLARHREMLNSGDISVTDFGTSPEFEKDYLPVYFPINLGLTGWRLAIINADDKTEFSNIKTLKQLKKKVAGQGAHWSDIKILEHAELQVRTAPSIDNIFDMVSRKRIDYFPLGVNEILGLLDKFAVGINNLVIDDKILIIYPFGRFFFVKKGNTKLRDILQKGLEESFNNGSFFKAFREHSSNQYIFNKAKLKQRNAIKIDNPNLTSEFKKIPKKYFFQMSWL